ncbi:28S ribosomal protein S29, mitochondrial-like [Mercenaria mercenaria]|uniref:28S ribosomal protein S29, mitochondrial-like n=1 Tax=Mercenaria mercenaria TaxID=6596 RepID=UPI00234EEA9D|nr:28S ribosomal protein S29, mitochondrial-like [Mercenaria mercenaria]
MKNKERFPYMQYSICQLPWTYGSVEKFVTNIRIMKKSLSLCRSYCQLLRQWARFSSQHRTQAGYIRSFPQTGTLQQGCCTSQILHHCRIGSYRQYCTTAEEIAEEDEDLVEVPSLSLHQKRTNILAKFRTEHNDPTNHTIDDEGMFYKVPHDEYEKYVQNKQWPGYNKQVKSFQESVIMVRRPALEAFDFIDNANLDYPPMKLMFYGKPGSGKTMTMAHVIHRYAKLGWLTIHFPSMIEWLRYRKTKPREYSMSSYKEGRFDYTDDAMEWLGYFKKQNAHLLQNIKTTKEYVWSQREKSLEGTELLDIIDFGISRRKYASDCIGVIFREIKLKASEKQLKVLVAVEGVNGFWKNTTIKEQKQLVSALQVSTFQHFLKLFQPDWTNGVCVGTVCADVEALDTELDRHKTPYTPHSLLKKQGFEFMDPFIPVLVPEYSSKEAHNCIDYYIERKWIIKPRALTEEGKKELMMLSNKNPFKLMEISTWW